MPRRLAGQGCGGYDRGVHEAPALHGPTLLAIARDALALRLGRSRVAWTDAPWLHVDAATFVTLRDAEGDLRGCVGSLVATRPLVDDVADNAVAAALRDTRFPPVAAGELDALALEVSVLTGHEPLPAMSEAQACDVLRPGTDGVILEVGSLRATFLPKVWDDLPEAGRFLAHLKRKAGLPASAWPDDLRLTRYRAITWSEKDS
jgi:AmmeMemoRadiSam system protein A